MEKPFSQACENNKAPILDALKRIFVDSNRVLEIGSGMGQHAVYFARHLPYLHWTPSDQRQYHQGINAWISEEPATNLADPVVFKVGENGWPDESFDAVFTANTAHIMQPEEVQLMLRLVALNLPEDGIFCQYGPFKVNGDFTSESNNVFDHSLVTQGYGGIRDIAELEQWSHGLCLQEVLEMPANNLLLHWVKRR